MAFWHAWNGGRFGGAVWDYADICPLIKAKYKDANRGKERSYEV